MYSYVFTFAVLMSVMTNTCQYFFWHQPQKPDFWSRWAPLALLVCATLLLLVAPLKNLVVNVCMASFRRSGFDSTIEHALDLAYLPAFSTRLMQVYTFLGYTIMLWSAALQVDLPSKFGTLLRASRARAAGAAPPAAEAC
uniref:Uncharacterized protein n=1 Tax=Alexandrium monilatum TaxID=311494 RepID=A0A7S4RPN9_9DINO|mmetsp:Transcript_17384/g.52451  ORF Transcript_17384/g.52451 Transcript_17384/m.52451 type:complete len:140 (+) Transcript_17384:297-716(+)